MKRVLLLAVLMTAMIAANAQGVARDSVPRVVNDGYYFASKKKVPKDGVQLNAGKDLQKSAVFDYCSLALAIGAGVAFSDAVFDERRSANTAGFAVGAAAVICKLAAINFKMKAGKALKVSPGGVRLEF